MKRADDSRKARDTTHARDTHDTGHDSRRTVVAPEEEHGGMKIGSAFFGWLSAMGMAVLLTALAAAAGTAFGVATGNTVDDATDAAAQQAETVGLVGGIVLLVILLIAYFCGGYVAGRMARFDGLKQGLGVWLWAIVIAIVAAALGALAGSEYNVLQRLDAFPRIPIDEGTLTTGGIVALVAVLLVTLGGALLGGVTGMRYHRRVDDTAGLRR